MSCGGCSKPKAEAKGYTKSADGLMVANDTMTAAAMCAACPNAGLVMCLVDGKALTTHARAVDCPKGRHPKDGVVRWAWLDWYGVPFPIRWRLKRKQLVSNPDRLPGCGCIRVLKDLSDKLGLT